MAASDRSASFDAFVTARAPRLLRLATLLLGDRAAGEAALSAELVRAWGRWGRSAASGSAAPGSAAEDDVVRGLVAAARRSAGAAVPAPRAALPPGIGTSRPEEVAARTALRARLAALPPGQRAVVVLRHAEGFPVPRVAALLREDPEQVARDEALALAALGQDPALADWLHAAEATA